MKKLPIGISDYKHLIEQNYYYVDKTDLIRAIWSIPGHVKLITRPRRFGKTLNLSMLKYFFEKTATNNEHLFTQTAIWSDDAMRALHGKFPVIFLTFKDIKESSWQRTYDKFAELIMYEFARHQSIVEPHLTPFELKHYQSIVDGQATYVQLTKSLFFLSSILSRVYKQKVFVLIDEYDTPVYAAYVHGYYSYMIEFLRSLLSGVFKDNNYLEQGVLSGTLRIAKEGIFSGLNNFSVFGQLDQSFSEYFGFTHSDVTQVLAHYNLTEHARTISDWHNGYFCGTTSLYNPWSVLNCVQNNGQVRPYWVNTSDNALIKKVIAYGQGTIKAELEILLSDVAIVKEIDEALIVPHLHNNEKAVWNLLYYSGYLTSIHHELLDGKDRCGLAIPNKEIKLLYTNLIHELFEQSLSSVKIQTLLQALTEGDIDLFTELLQEFIISSMSMFDFSDAEPEKSYHLFVLGLLVSLRTTHEVKSNRESGYGRYDIMIIPHDTAKLGIIIEFKKVFKYRSETLELACDRALEQIQEKEYAHELLGRGITNILALGIAFQGKKVCVKSSTDFFVPGKKGLEITAI